MAVARIYTCLDDPAPTDGTCTSAAWVEQPSSAWPALTVEQGEAIGQKFMIACIAVLVIKLFLKPSTHRRS